MDGHLLPAGRTATNPPHAAAAGETDRQTNTVPFHRHCFAYYASTANKTTGILWTVVNGGSSVEQVVVAVIIGRIIAQQLREHLRGPTTTIRW